MIINKTYDEFINEYNEINKEKKISADDIPRKVVKTKIKEKSNKDNKVSIEKVSYDIDKILAIQDICDNLGFCIASFIDENKKENIALRWYSKGQEGFPILKKNPNGGAWFAIPNDKDVLKELAQELIKLL